MSGSSCRERLHIFEAILDTALDATSKRNRFGSALHAHHHSLRTILEIRLGMTTGKTYTSKSIEDRDRNHAFTMSSRESHPATSKEEPRLKPTMNRSPLEQASQARSWSSDWLRGLVAVDHIPEHQQMFKPSQRCPGIEDLELSLRDESEGPRLRDEVKTPTNS